MRLYVMPVGVRAAPLPADAGGQGRGGDWHNAMVRPERPLLATHCLERNKCMEATGAGWLCGETCGSARTRSDSPHLTLPCHNHRWTRLPETTGTGVALRIVTLVNLELHRVCPLLM